MEQSVRFYQLADKFCHYNKNFVNLMEANSSSLMRNRMDSIGINLAQGERIMALKLTLIKNGYQNLTDCFLSNNSLYLKVANQILILNLGFWTVLEPIDLKGRENCFALRLNQKEQLIFRAGILQINILKSKFSTIGIMRGFYQDYKPIYKIGSGKSASVFLAKERHTGQKVAIKAFSKNQMRNQTRSLRALQNQIQILRTVNDSSVVRFRALYETQKSFYIVTDLVEGKTLKNLIYTEDLDYTRIVEILKKLLKVLVYLSTLGIVHRDLKPQNIIVESNSNNVVIVDFGLATFCEQKQHVFKHCGTPGFIAPQILDQNCYDLTSKADMFSLGIIFHLMLFKKFPYKNACNENIVELNREANFQFTDSQYSEIPEGAVELLEKMLAKSQKNRGSASDLLKHLQQQSYGTSFFKAPVKWIDKYLVRSNSQRPRSLTRAQKAY